MAKIVRQITSKGSWILVLLLLGFVWHLHSHKKTLHKDLEVHKDEKEGLMQQLGHLDSTVAAKTKEAQEYQRLHSQVTSVANQVSYSCA
jgi:predicted RNase H-like nuclease (RuvC/YqgF family)